MTPEQIITHHYARMVKYIRQHIPQDQAEDVVQDAVRELWTYPQALLEIAALPDEKEVLDRGGALFYSVCKKRLGLHYRQQEAHRAFKGEHSHKRKPIKLVTPLWEMLADQKLPERTRLIIKDYYARGETLEEIGAGFAMSGERIRQILRKALLTLREEWV